MKCLIVDDSEPRVRIISESLSKLPSFHLLDVVFCGWADCARIELQHPVDILVLDVLIPKKKGGLARAENSVSLLSDICNPRKNYIRPQVILGLTADIAELGIYQEQFARDAAVVLRGSLTELDWLDSLNAQIASVLATKHKISRQEKDRLLISVHGIRTYGHWQAKISEEVRRSSRSFNTVELKYGFLDFFCFVIPYFRKKVISREALKLERALERSRGREIHVVAHSFGTLIVSEALKKNKFAAALKTVIFCGSPMRADDDIEHVLNSSELTVNDCGIDDLIVIVARVFLIGLGDAGRIGFRRENSDNFQNRYFFGGHSLYFKKARGDVAFYERYWIPVITLGRELKRVDLRRNYFGEDILDFLIKVLTFFKPLVYLAGAAYLLMIAFNWIIAA